MLRRGLVRLEQHDGKEFSSIQRVLRVLSAIDRETVGKIETAHDHKGCLSICWKQEPNENDMRSLEHAWKEENEILLEYVFPNGNAVEVQAGS